MKTTLIATSLAVVAGFGALADETTNMNGTASNLSSTQMNANQGSMAGKLGVGVIFGDPTGASAKLWLDNRLAVDGAVGWSPYDHTDLYVHSDLLWHDFDLLKVPQGRLPVYFGVGALVRFRSDHFDNQVGVRAPIGVSYMFDNIPVDVFAEIAAAVLVAPSIRGNITGGVGIRYWF